MRSAADWKLVTVYKKKCRLSGLQQIKQYEMLHEIEVKMKLEMEYFPSKEKKLAAQFENGWFE